MSLNIGGARQKSSGSSKPFFRDTGYSSFSGKRFTLDPSIRTLQDQAVGQYAGIYGDVGQNTDRFLNQSSSLRDRFIGNQGAYMNARVNPIRERFSALRGQAQQDIGRRRIGGSTFGYDTLTGIDREASRLEGDARAIATNEAAQFENQLNAQELDALNQAAANRAKLTGETLEVARLRLAQEMGIFSLGNKQQSTQSGTQWGAKANLWGPPSGGSVPSIF